MSPAGSNAVRGIRLVVGLLLVTAAGLGSVASAHSDYEGPHCHYTWNGVELASGLVSALLGGVPGPVLVYPDVDCHDGRTITV